MAGTETSFSRFNESFFLQTFIASEFITLSVKITTIFLSGKVLYLEVFDQDEFKKNIGIVSHDTAPLPPTQHDFRDYKIWYAIFVKLII